MLPSPSAAKMRNGAAPAALRDSRRGVSVDGDDPAEQRALVERRDPLAIDPAGRQVVERGRRRGRARAASAAWRAAGPDALQRLDLGEQRIENVGAHRLRIPSASRDRNCLHGLRIKPAGAIPLRAHLRWRMALAWTRSSASAEAIRAWHRGTREADMLIGGFFDAHHAGWDDARDAPGSRPCSRSRTSTSWPGRSEPPSRPSASRAR